MKISEFIESIKKNIVTRPLNVDYCEKIPTKGYNIDNLKIIGITGSYGKSTVCYMIHNYLKLIGKKSVLYSSIMVDSPASIIDTDSSYEIACKNENMLVSILNEAKAYEAEYLVLEINESVIEKGFINDVPFYVKVLTNLYPNHNLNRYTSSEYINLKKTFFSQNDYVASVLCFQNYSKELLEEFIDLSKNKKTYLCTNKYIQDLYGIDNASYLLTECKNTLNGLELKIKENNNDINIKTNICMFHNAMNILISLVTIKALDLFIEDKFNNLLHDFTIPGRTEIIKANKRVIVIDSHLPKVLENLKEYQDCNEIKDIIVVMGSIGSSFRSWNSYYKSKEFISSHHKAKKYAVELVEKYANKLYFTESDSGSENPIDICLELKSYLNNNTKSYIFVRREEAIKEAIKNSNDGDCIFISGRGNRSIMCISETKVRHIKDIDIVIDTLKELGWMINE